MSPDSKTAKEVSGGDRPILPRALPSFTRVAVLAFTAVVPGVMADVLAADCTPAPAPNTWQTCADMPTARGALGVASGPDGRIYAIGGRHPVTGTVEAYDPPTNTWTGRASMPTPRDSLAVVTANDGKIYAIGGEDTVTGALYNTVEAYDPVTDTWTTKTAMPTRRQGLAAAVGLDGRIYAIGGVTGPVPAGPFTSVGTTEVYDPATDTWTTAAAMPTPRHGLAAALGSDGRIYAIGGFGGTSTPCPGVACGTVEAYDPATNTWIARASMPTSRTFLAAVAATDGKVYAIGGYDGGSDLSTVEAYDPGSNTWTSMTPMPTPRCELAAAFGVNGKIYAIGGSSCRFGGSLRTNEAFLPPGAQYAFTGFFLPVQNPPVLNLVTAGRGVPVKFSLGGDQGLNIFAAGFPASQRIACDTGAPIDVVEETVTAGSSSLTYDPVTDQYTYVWKTEKKWADTCRRLNVRLNDGTDHFADFTFR